MQKTFKDLSIVFAAGAAGGFVNRIFIWLFGVAGISSRLCINLAPELSENFLYTGIVWGGIWGIIFLLPYRKSSLLEKAAVFSILPSLVMLFVVFPFWLDKGMFGSELGSLTFILVFFFNFIRAITTCLWLKLIEYY